MAHTGYYNCVPVDHQPSIFSRIYSWGTTPYNPNPSLNKINDQKRVNANIAKNGTTSVFVFASDTTNILPPNVELVGMKIKLNCCVQPPMKHIGTNVCFHTWISLDPLYSSPYPEIIFNNPNNNPGVVAFKPAKSNIVRQKIIGEEDSISWQLESDPFPLLKEELVPFRLFVMAANMSNKRNTFGIRGPVKIDFFYNEFAGRESSRVIDEFSILAFRVDSDINGDSAGFLDNILVRWNQPVKVQLHNAESEDATQVAGILGLFSNLTGLSFNLSDDDPQIHIWYVPNNEFENYVDVTGIDVNEVKGICNADYNESFEITSAVCVVSNDSANSVSRQQTMRHQLCHAIGMSHSFLQTSTCYPDFISNNIYYLSIVDRKVVQLMYDFSPGSTKEDCLDYLNSVSSFRKTNKTKGLGGKIISQ